MHERPGCHTCRIRLISDVGTQEPGTWLWKIEIHELLMGCLPLLPSHESGPCAAFSLVGSTSRVHRKMGVPMREPALFHLAGFNQRPSPRWVDDSPRPRPYWSCAVPCPGPYAVNTTEWQQVYSKGLPHDIFLSGRTEYYVRL